MRNGQILSANDSHVKVLVVDDHPNTANMLARAIARMSPNVEVVSATSGYEALKHAENGSVDILITDMMMPEMTGLELIEMLHDQPATSPAVSFLLTAHDSAGLREIAQRSHVKQVIAKPVHPEWICQLISQTVDSLKHAKTVDDEPARQAEPIAGLGEETEFEVLNIDHLLWDVAKKFQSQADVKDQLLVIGKTEPDAKIRGNEAQLRHALRNLVWDAIENTPMGGTVLLSSEYESNTIKILVRDTGYGVIPVGLREILDEHPASPNDHSGDKDEYKQTMTEAKSIAERHGGNLRVENEIGKGSCFIMQLPILANKAVGTSSDIQFTVRR